MSKQAETTKKRMPWRALIGALRLTHRLDHWALPVSMTQALLQAVTPYLNIYFTARILDELTGPKRVSALLVWVLWALVTNLVAALSHKALLRLWEVRNDGLYFLYFLQLNCTMWETDYENLDEPQLRSLRQKIDEAQNMGLRGPWSLVPLLCSILGGALAVGLSTALSLPLFRGGSGALASPAMAVLFVAALIVVSSLASWASLRAGQRVYRLSDRFMGSNRAYSFLFPLLFNPRYGPDARIYRQQDIARQAAEKLDDPALVRNIAVATARGNAIHAAITAVLSGGVYLFVGLKALTGVLSIGMAFQVIGAIGQFIGGFTQLVTQAMEFRLNGEYVQDYMDFLSTPNAKYQGTLPVEKRDDQELELELRHVSFRYPGTEEWALRDVSLKLRIGERLAVVGRNGSGKTTMIKLLCRLYDPQEGEILLNGIDIRKYDYAEYLSLFSVVFQDFKLFHGPLGQNVAAHVEYDRQRAEDSLREAGFPPESWHKGLDTPVYQDEEDGVKPSGGEAQKIALARALYKRAPVVVLDEPTAALDPLAEHDIYTRFNDFVGDRTAIYISHRLSSCRFCDDIAVFDEGRMVQRGGHDQLLADEQGLYFQLWNVQAQYYQQEKTA